jgi:hypothetical protein
MRRCALSLLFLAALTASTTSDSFDARVMRFQVHWDRFLRGFWGCVPADATRDTCRAEMGSINRKEFDAARRAAADLFEFAKKE